MPISRQSFLFILLLLLCGVFRSTEMNIGVYSKIKLITKHQVGNHTEDRIELNSRNVFNSKKEHKNCLSSWGVSSSSLHSGS